MGNARLEVTAPTTQRKPGALFIVIVASVIVLWQVSFKLNSEQIDGLYWSSGSTGLSRDLRKFFTFYWNLGYFPLTVIPAHPDAVRSDERTLAEQHGRELAMGYNRPANATRDGDWGKLFLFIPDALRRG